MNDLVQGNRVKMDAGDYPEKDPLLIKESKALTEEALRTIEEKIKEDETAVSLSLKTSKFSLLFSLCFTVVFILLSAAVYLVFFTGKAADSDINTEIIDNALLDKIAMEAFLLDKKLDEAVQQLDYLKHNKEQVIAEELQKARQELEQTYRQKLTELRASSLTGQEYENRKAELEREKNSGLKNLESSVRTEIAELENELSRQKTHMEEQLKESQKNLEQHLSKEAELVKSVEAIRLQLTRAQEEKAETLKRLEEQLKTRQNLEAEEQQASLLHAQADASFTEGDYQKAYEVYKRILLNFFYSRSKQVAASLIKAETKLAETDRKIPLGVAVREYRGAGNTQRGQQSADSSVQAEAGSGDDKPSLQEIFSPRTDPGGQLEKADTLLKAGDDLAALEAYINFLSALPFENLSKEALQKSRSIVAGLKTGVKESLAQTEPDQGPVVHRIQASFAEIIGEADYGDNKIVVADRQGIVICLNAQGEVLWKMPTANNPNDNSFPLALGSNVYFTGSNEFNIINLTTGKTIKTLPLDAASAHLFGNRIVRYKDKGLYPTLNSVRQINLATGAIENEFGIPGGTFMTPAVYNDSIVIMNQQGVLLLINPLNKMIETRIESTLEQPFALAAAIYRDQAVIGDRKGKIACFSLSQNKLLWESSFGTAAFAHDLEFNSSGIFAYSKGICYCLTADGTALYPALTGLSSPPLYAFGILYYGTDSGDLMIADAETGLVLRSLKLGERIKTKPVFIMDHLVVGTEAGRVLIINPELIQ